MPFLRERLDNLQQRPLSKKGSNQLNSAALSSWGDQGVRSCTA